MDVQQQLEEIARRLDAWSDGLEGLLELFAQRRKVDEAVTACLERVPKLWDELAMLGERVADLQRREVERLEREAQMSEALTDALQTIAAFQNVSIN